MATSISPQRQAVYAQLERILASAPFAASERSRRFLRYIVDNSFGDSQASLKEYAIAIEVFERDASYDPAVDATVRVEAGRLRTRLRDYYAGDGRNDALVIAMPKGGYRAVLIERELQPTAAKRALDSDAGPELIEKGQHSGSGRSARSALFRRGLAWGAALLAIGALIGWTALHLGHHARPTMQARMPIRLAVLPFLNTTGTAENDYLTSGMTDNLIRQLSELPNVHVMSRAAVDGVKPEDAASRLRVAALLTGTLQRNADGRLVLDTELSSTRDGTVLSSRQHLADESDLPSVQADIVNDAIRGLGLEVDAGETQPITSSPAAFRSFLKGESAALDPSPQGLHAAIRNYEDAVAQDPHFALAYSSLAEAHTLLGLYYEPAREHMPLARQYTQHALQLDPSLAEAHGTLGLIHLVYDWDFNAARHELAAADARDSAMRVLSCTAHLHLLGEPEDIRHAEEDVRRMLEFDPHSSSLIGELGCISYYAERFGDSDRYYRQAIAADPRAAINYWGAGRSLAQQGKYAEALQVLHRFDNTNGSEPPMITAEIAYAEAASGERQMALATIQRLQQESRHGYVDPFFFAVAYLGLKDGKHTYEWLDRAYEARSPLLVSIGTDPKWIPLHQDARFETIWDSMLRGGPIASSTANLVTKPQ